MSRAGIQIYRWEGGLFNALCAIYFLTLGPLVVEAADKAMRVPDSRVHWLGFLIIGISLAEVYAFPAKLRFVRTAAREYGDSTGAGFILWMFHAVISIILLFLAAGAFGVKISESSGSEMPTWLALLFPVIVIKELVFLGFLMWDKSDTGESTKSEPEPEADARYERPNRREWLLDLILLSYACIAYSATWGAITINLSLEKENPVMLVVNLFVSSLLFLIFYLPLRIPYWLEEIAQTKTQADWLKLTASILMVLIPAIARLG
ncbi:hypothetical protein VSU19_08645 [Verrucomicrobiales bacterium BCK34]|nr:hypothetical protein [Verrucomicrobiales bacterium BCK34]